jgi:ribosomal protein S18 acetylase RimI-like enzyme
MCAGPRRSYDDGAAGGVMDRPFAYCSDYRCHRVGHVYPPDAMRRRVSLSGATCVKTNGVEAFIAERPWDSRVLERKTAWIEAICAEAGQPRGTELDRAVGESMAAVSDAALMVMRMAAGQEPLKRALAARGFETSDTLEVFMADVRAAPPGEANGIRAVAAGDEAPITAIAQAALVHGRVQDDPRLPGSVKANFRAAMGRSLGGMAEGGFGCVAVREDEVTGFAVGARSEEPWSSQAYGVLSLIAVAPAAQSAGIGQALLRNFLYLSRENGLSFVEIATQSANTAACRLYARLGIPKVGAIETMHWHR